MDFGVIDKAGLTQAQFASLVGVSRVTVNTWVMGRYRPGNAVRERVIRALGLIKQAFNEGKLPINATIQDELLQKQLDRIASKLARGG